MRIATWNVNNVVKRLPHLLAYLEATKPDVVCLQELKTLESSFPRKELEAAGYGCLVVGQKSWNGVALLARGMEPVTIRRNLPGDDEDNQARYCEAAVNGVIVASLYLPNGNPHPGPKFDYKNVWFGRLQVHAKQLIKTGLPTVLAGDFNVVPTDEPRDIYATRSFADNALLQPEPRAAYAAMLKAGWTDAIAQKHPDGRLYTFWSLMRNRWPRDAGLRIDHLLLSKSLKTKLVDAGVDRALRGLPEPSDHAPAWVELTS
jgi:exodeoxyribonuclease-3